MFVRFAETGEALVSSVDKIIFVGSPGVGRMVWHSYRCFNILLSFLKRFPGSKIHNAPFYITSNL